MKNNIKLLPPIIHGIDVTEHHRVEYLHPLLPKRVLTDKEYNDYLNLPIHDRPLFLATRWAIKEAIYKALPVTLPLHHLEIQYQGSKYKFTHNDYFIVISISHVNKSVHASVVGYLKSMINCNKPSHIS